MGSNIRATFLDQDDQQDFVSRLEKDPSKPARESLLGLYCGINHVHYLLFSGPLCLPAPLHAPFINRMRSVGEVEERVKEIHPLRKGRIAAGVMKEIRLEEGE